MPTHEYSAVVPDFQYFLDLVPCRTACPVHTNAGGYVRAVAEWDTARGYRIARAPNPLASICGRICAHPCESKCRRGVIDQPISIRALKRTLTERHGVENVLGDQPAPLEPLHLAVTGEDGATARIAIVGAGPAGLSCAHDLALLGYRVTLFEAAPVVGGMLSQGVPEYRLARDLIRAEVDRILALGVELKLEWRLGRDATVGDLRRQGFAAVFLALGASRGRDLNIPGHNLDGVINGVDFLLNANLGYRVALGERVIVIGGGNVAVDVARTALRYAAGEPHELPGAAEATLQTPGYDNAFLDAARTALRLGARHVQLVSLESRAQMPAHPDEVREAEEEGIALLPGLGPKAILGADGHAVALETLTVASLFDASGRFSPTFTPGTEQRFEADTIILAVGQQPDTACLAADTGITLTPRGLVAVDRRTLATTMDRVYCGGDLAFGPRIVIEAEADGKRAALAIHEALGGGAVPRAHARFRPVELNRAGDHYDRVPRQAVPALPVARRTGFREVEEGYSEEQARLEASRCLRCNVETIFDSERCILCSGCVEICPEACLALVPGSNLRTQPDIIALSEALDAGEDAGAIIKDEARCIRCGLCAERCPTGAITMESLEIDESPQTALGLYHEGMREVRT
jgi:NADPH-dependent glutamate synthase beta subunit-like oxidoreductase